MSRTFLRSVAAASLIGASLAGLAVGIATAEQTGRDGVKAVFNASISPSRLSRNELEPVSVTLSGAVRSTDGSSPPPLGRIELAFGARGGLDTSGLARCPRARLRNATHRQALARCRSALVGRGTILTEVALNPLRPLLARAAALAFNASIARHPAVLVQAYSASPPVSFVLPFRLRRLSGGAFGTLLRAPVAHVLGRWPRLRSFQITLGRRYRTGGRRHSYLNARCPLPPRFHSLSVPMARATYHFAPAPTMATAILRACRVRE
jgi:hypothetical protein